MKKSDVYVQAQLAVLTNNAMGGLTKLEILRELMYREDLEAFNEKVEVAKSNETEL